MTPANTIRPLDDILFVVVTCTMEQSREKALRRLIQSINKQHRNIGFRDNLLVFDNGSTLTSGLERLQAPAIFAMSPENIGYWSALKWSMDHAEKCFGRSFEYIHPIESDLVMYRMERLAEAKAFLDQMPNVETVRTQEFSVSHRNRYFKNRPVFFARRRSRVADYNAITEDQVSFEKCPEFENIYLSNWHAKVPALHRMSGLKAVFEQLNQQDQITEFDFMKLMFERSRDVAVLDKGIFYTTSYRPTRKQVSGSYSDHETLQGLGYRQSRNDSMTREFNGIRIETSPIGLR
jgi:glycosyltransferase involved in cell wall biosynthesis